MPTQTVKCPNYLRCRNMKQPDAEMCNACRLAKRKAQAGAGLPPKTARPAFDPSRKVCPGFAGHPCGGLKDADSEMCGACRITLRAQQRDARLAQERADRIAQATARADAAARVAANEPTAEDKLREDNALLRRELQAMTAAVSTYKDRAKFEDDLADRLLRHLEENPYLPPLTPFKPRSDGGRSSSDHEMLLLLSDAHFPEKVDPSATLGLEYNGPICLRRLERVRDTAIRYKDLRGSAYEVRKLSVAVLGDMLSGNIHDELEVTNEKPASEAMVEMTYALYDMGRAFAESFEEVEFIVMPGNHPRFTKKPRSKNKWDNWEWVMGKFLEGLARDQFKVTVPKDIIYPHRIFDFKVGLTHGDGVQAQSFAGIPWYSMKQRRDALQALLKTLGQPQLDLLCYGHFHQLIFEEGAGCSLIINGSIKGGDEYGVTRRYQAPPAVQALLTFHPRRGITDLSRINLDQVR